MHSFGNWPETFHTKTKKFEFFSTRIEASLEKYAAERSVDDIASGLGISSRGDEINMPHYEEKRPKDERKDNRKKYK